MTENTQDSFVQVVAKKRGRPAKKIKLRDSQDENVTTPTVEDEQIESRFIPYTGSKDLPPAKLDKRGRIQKVGAPHYFLRGSESAGFKLIAVYKNGKGIGRRLVARLKSKKYRNPKEVLLLKELRDCGVLGEQ